jgi:hypothetical protein
MVSVFVVYGIRLFDLPCEIKATLFLPCRISQGEFDYFTSRSFSGGWFDLFRAWGGFIP